MRREAILAQQGEDRLLEIKRLGNAALKAEEDRRTAEIAATEEQKRAQQLTAGGFGQDAAGAIAGIESAIGRTLTGLEQLRVSSATTAAQLGEDLPTIAGIFTQASDAIVDSLAPLIASFVSGKQRIRQVAAAFYAAALQPLKDYLLKKSKIQIALGIADLADFNFPGAAKHFLAGAALAAAAGLIDVGGSLIGGSTNEGGTVGAGISPSGGGSSAGGTRVIQQGETRPIQPAPQPVQVIIRASVAPGAILDVVHQDIKDNGQTRQLIKQNAGG